MNSKPNGFVLYEGASTFDGENIVVVVTGFETPSSNTKTGNMLQSWIIKQKEYPSEAIKLEKDGSVCGTCPLKGKVCYVTMMGPNNIWRSYKEGQYPIIDSKILDKIKRRHKLLRLGAYGDPCAVPLEVWQPLIAKSQDYTGYTHAWQYTNQRWNQYIRASVESHTLKAKANNMGWKTFRITTDPNDILEDEVWCKNLEDEDTKCEDCRLCNAGKGKPNVVTLVHGAKWKVNNYKELVSV